MRFTFGIITSDNQESRVQKIVNDINDYSPDSEIVVVGGSDMYNNVKHIHFDETKKSGWITRKKNLVTKYASNENIVYMHDYITIDKNWNDGWEWFGDNWDICMTAVNNPDGTRFRDWCAWDDPELCYLPSGQHWACLVPYSYSKKQHMYISGAYWVAKKSVMEEEPLNEELCWGEAEDVEWSYRIRKKFNYKMNPYSTVKLLKQKDVILKDKS